MPGVLEAVNKPAAEKITRAFSKMTGESLSVDITELGMESVDTLTSVFAPDEQVVALVDLPIHCRDVAGTGMLVMSLESALSMADLMRGKTPGTCRELGAMDKAALMEAGNIVVGCYLTEMSNVLHLELIPDMPAFRCGAFGEILKKTISRYNRELGGMVVVKILFTFESVVVKGLLLLCFEEETMEKFLPGHRKEDVAPERA